MKSGELLKHIGPRSFITSGILLIACLFHWSSPLSNQTLAASPITASGLNTQITISATPPPGKVQYDITGGTRPGGGTNLYHSFGEFGVPTDNIANFLNESGLATSNILGRVTGGNVSSIYGMIQTTNFGTANLFLMNPSGFLFGPNATVNVGGMMTFTTAEYLRLSDNVRFQNVPDAVADALLSSAPVAAFGFIGSNPSAITFEAGQLTVTEGSSLSLVGGGLNLIPDSFGTPSGITAPGRALQITSVGGPGEVSLETGGPSPGMVLGDITFDLGTVISTVGDPSFGDGSGGPISIRGGHLVATGATMITGPAEGSAGSGGAISINVTGSTTFTDSSISTAPAAFSFSGSAGSVTISAKDSITLTNTFIDASSQFTGGDGGPVTLTTNGAVSLTDSFIGTGAYDTAGPGNGGAVTISGKDVVFNNSGIGTDVSATFPDVTTIPALAEVRPGAVTVQGVNSVTFSGSLFNDPGIPVINTIAFGTLLDGGSVSIAAKTVNLSNGTIDATIAHSELLVTPSSGNGGTIEIRSNDAQLSHFTLRSNNAGWTESPGKGGRILLRGADNSYAESIHLTASEIDAASVSGGGGGSIEFNTKTLTMGDSSLVRTVSLGRGAGGSITASATESMTIQSESQLLTDVVAGIAGVPQGSAGDILIETQRLALLSGGQIGARNLVLSTGNAGNITVQGGSGPANSFLIDGSRSGIFSTTEGTGSGGNINVVATAVTIQNSGTLSATTSGTASSATGGTITVNANTVSVSTGGSMTAASTGAGAAGDIIVQGLASPANSVLVDGSLSGIFTNTSGTGAGGSIFVEGNAVTLQNGAHVSSSSTGTGVAGDININAGNQFAMTNSSVTTEANQSSGGAIKITTAPSGTVQLTNSQISASVLDGTGGGGSVDIDPQFVILQNSQITANAVNGPGGNIFITTNLLLPDSTSVISASSQFGQQGTITIQSPVSPASGKLNPISQKPLITAAMVNQRCAALAGGIISSFTVAGRDILPAEPGGWISSPLALGISESEEGTIREAGSRMEDSTSLVSLRKIAPPGFLRQTFAVGSSDCQS